jgi:hypothetical protein
VYVMFNLQYFDVEFWGCFCARPSRAGRFVPLVDARV